jgi:hypothetical protein
VRRLGLVILAFAGSWLLWPQRSDQSYGSSEYGAESLRQARRQANWTRNAGIIASLAFLVAATGAYFGWRALALTQQQTVKLIALGLTPANLNLLRPSKVTGLYHSSCLSRIQDEPPRSDWLTNFTFSPSPTYLVPNRL